MEQTGPLGPPELPKTKAAGKIAYGKAPETDDTVELAVPPKLTAKDHGSPEIVEEVRPTATQEPEPAEPAQPATDDAETADADEPDSLNEYWHEPGDPDGLVAAEEKQKQEAAHKSRQEIAGQPPQKRHKKKRKLPLILAAIVVLAAAATGGYLAFGRKASDSAVQDRSARPAQTTHAASQAISTKRYDSTIYTLGFDYPETWKIADTAAKLTVTSPSLQLTTSDGQKVSGHVQLTIQNQQTTIAGYPAAGATATLASEKVAYKQPTTIQRAQTYLSYLSYKGMGLDAVYVTGDNGYQLQQSAPMPDIVKGNPLIHVSFLSCSSEDCASGVPSPLTVQTASWQSASFRTQITDLITSIQLQ